MPLKNRYNPMAAGPSSAPAAEPGFMQRMGGLRGLLGTGARIGSGMLAVEGGPLGAGIAGGGEALAELIEGSDLNPGRIAVEGSIGAVPLSSVFKLGKAGTSALRSGALSAAGTAGRQLSMGEDIDPRGIAESGGLGALLGGFIGKMSSPRVAPPAGQMLESEPVAQAAAESEQLLKAKMAEEAQPRPAEWDQYPPEVAQELDKLGLQYRSAPEGLEKRGLGAQLQELRMFMSGKNAKGQPYMREGWRGAPATGVPVATPPAAPVDPNWVQRETAVADDIGRQLEQQAGGPPPADPGAPDWVNEQSSLVDKLKALLTNQSGGGGERGEISPEALKFLSGTAGGALLGSITNPTGDPLEGAGIGAVTGMAGVTFGPKIISGMKNLGAAPEMIQQASEHLATEGPKKTAQRIFETWPQFQRFNMLIDPIGLPANAFVGPWGSAMTGAIEAGLSGDERGWRLAKAMASPEFAQQFPKHWHDAVELIRNGDLGRAETIISNTSIGKGMMLPGTLMTTGDVTAREMGKARGFSEDEMRGMTMTNEPEFEGFRKIANFTKNSPMLQTLMPFTKTLANMGEQASMRAPVLGLFVQAMREAPDPVRQQLVQQAMSVGIGGANYFLGQQLSPEEAKIVRRYATNIAGRYGVIAGAGFAAGQASAQGKDPLSAGILRGTQEALPLPTTEIPESWINFIFGGEGARPPRGLMPTAASDVLFPQSTPAPKLPRIRIRRPQ